MGMRGRNRRRTPAASPPITRTDNARRRAKGLNRPSIPENKGDFARPQHNASAKARRTNPSSIRNRETSLPKGGGFITRIQLLFRAHAKVPQRLPAAPSHADKYCPLAYSGIKIGRY